MSDFESAQPYKTATSPSKTTETTTISSEERNWAMAAHLVPLATFLVTIPFVSIIAPVIVWFLKRETMPFVDDQAKESINFQITVSLLGVVCFILVFFVVGIPLLFALMIANVVFCVLAAKAAQEGRTYRYPFTLRLL